MCKEGKKSPDVMSGCESTCNFAQKIGLFILKKHH